MLSTRLNGRPPLRPARTQAHDDVWVHGKALPSSDVNPKGSRAFVTSAGTNVVMGDVSASVSFGFSV